MIVTLGPTERPSLSRSDAGALLTEMLGLWETLALWMEIVGCRDVGDGDGDLAPSRWVLGLINFEKIFGAMKPQSLWVR